MVTNLSTSVLACLFLSTISSAFLAASSCGVGSTIHRRYIDVHSRCNVINANNVKKLKRFKWKQSHTNQADGRHRGPDDLLVGLVHAVEEPLEDLGPVDVRPEADRPPPDAEERPLELAVAQEGAELGEVGPVRQVNQEVLGELEAARKLKQEKEMLSKC